MTVAAIQAPVSSTSERVSSLVEVWAQRCLDAGKPPSEVVTDADLAATDVAVARYLLRAGAIFETNKRLAAMRLPGPEEPQREPRRNPMHAAQGRNPTTWRALGVALVAADGALRSLLTFTADDLKDLSVRCRGQAEAWDRRDGWAKAALAALAKYRAEAVEELPVEVLAELDGMASEAWR